MHQKNYALDILKKFRMLNYNSLQITVDTNLKLVKNANETFIDPSLYKQMVACLIYLCNIKHDKTYEVGLVSRFIKAPKISFGRNKENFKVH